MAYESHISGTCLGICNAFVSIHIKHPYRGIANHILKGYLRCPFSE